MRPSLHARVVAEQLGREEQGEVALADAGRAVEEIRVRRAFRQGGREEALRLELFGQRVEAH